MAGPNETERQLKRINDRLHEVHRLVEELEREMKKETPAKNKVLQAISAFLSRWRTIH